MSNLLQQVTVTTTPNPPASPRRCPRCDNPLVYGHSVLLDDQRSDTYRCPQCGPFLYDHQEAELRFAGARQKRG